MKRAATSKAVKKQLEREKYFASALNLISYRPRSVKEVLDHLTKKGASSAMANLITRKLTRLDYLDDAKFARAWIRSRLKLKPKGERALRAELANKGVDSKLINLALEELGVKAAEVDMARSLLEKKLKAWRDLPILKRKQRAFSFLGRRGFSTATIMALVDAVSGNE